MDMNQQSGNNYYDSATSVVFDNFQDQGQNQSVDPNQNYYAKSTENLNYYSSNYDDPNLQNYTYTQPYETEIEVSWLQAFGSGGLPGEPSLLEELDINFSHVKEKTITVLNPFRTIDHHILNDVDLIGPLIFCLLLGFAMGGKVQFGYIYGVAMVGWIGIYALINLLSNTSIDGLRVASTLGYCLLPIVILAIILPIIEFGLNSTGLKPYILTFSLPITILWSTFTASNIFTISLQLTDQKFLVMYPVALLYTCFSLITFY